MKRSEKAYKRNRTRRLADAVSDCCEQFGVPEPGVALAHFAAGVDPRRQSALLHEIRELAIRYRDCAPPADAWVALAERLADLAPFIPVSREESLGAIKALMPFLHAKKSEVELSGRVDVPIANVTPAQIAEAIQELNKEV